MIGVGKNIGSYGQRTREQQYYIETSRAKSSKGRGTSSGYHSKLRD